MQVVQATFAVYHQFELAHQMLNRGHLRRIYSTWPWARVKREGIPREYVDTFPLVNTADYLLNRTRYYPRSVSIRMNRWNALSFDAYTRRSLPQCDAFIAISGAGLDTGKLAQSRGAKFICDRGSTHQRFQEEVVRGEYKRWNVPLELDAPHIVVREEQIYDAADAITVPSSAVRRSFLQMGMPQDKIHVIPYGVRLDRFIKDGDAPKDSFEVLFAGQVGLRKGVPYLLEAFARLRHPKKHLTLAGSIAEHIRPLLATLPTENVTFLGAIPQTELISRMSRSHVMVLPSIEEGLALVQAQALACQLPVIATEATGAEDLFSDQVEGFIVKDRDVDALSERIQRLADEPHLRQQMSAAALRRVKSFGGWDTYGDRWERLLLELTSRDG